jgi:segregation and condensation protein B
MIIGNDMSHEKILEAALFMSSRPLMLDDLGKLMGVNSLGYVKEALEKLQKDYEGRGMEIVSTPLGWVMQVRPELLKKVSHLTPYADISEGSKRSLAIIAYKEPVMQAEIIRIQGNKAYSYLKDLRKRNLIKMEKKGHTKEITLTSEFERYFGEEKERIKERLESSQKRESDKKSRKQEKAEVKQKPAKEHEKQQLRVQEPEKPKKKSDIDSILT